MTRTAAPYRRQWPELAVLLLWCSLAAWAVHLHVPWADESQAWLLAGENSWAALFFHLLHYEGTGGLWHAFLKLFAAAHLPFTAARYAAASAQAVGVAVLLFRSPFPRALRLTLPFTFFLFFQDAIVARSYCLFAVLAFPAAVLLRGGRPRPKALALLTGLLANLSIHGVLLGAGLLAVAFLRWSPVARLHPFTPNDAAQGKNLRLALFNDEPSSKMGRLPALREFLFAPRPERLRNGPSFALHPRRTALLAALPFFLFAAATMAPAPDVDFQAGGNLHNSLAKALHPLGVHLALAPSVAALPMSGLQPAPVPVHLRRGAQGFLNRVGRVLGVLTFPLSRSRVVALLLIGAVLAQARHRAGLIPWLLMAAVFSSLYLAPRHVGTLFTGFLVSAWMTWPTREDAHLRPWLTVSTSLLMLLVTCEQIGWTAHTLAAERTRPYSPARMTAQYLKDNSVDQGATAAGYLYFSSAPLLYFLRNIYLNQPAHRFWLWSTAIRSYQPVEQTLVLHPRFIVVSTVQPGPEGEVTRDWLPAPPPLPGVVLGDQFGFADWFTRRGYHRTKLFCGESLMRASYAERLCDIVLERDQQETPGR